MDQLKSAEGETESRKELAKGMNENDQSREHLLSSERMDESEMNDLDIKSDGVKERERNELHDDAGGKDDKMNEMMDGETNTEGKMKKLSSEVQDIGMKDEKMDKLEEARSSDGQMNKLNGENNEWRVDEFGSMTLLDDTDYVMIKEEVSSAPIDRGWAWMSVVGCFGMHILAVGGIKCFGVLFVELEHHYDTTSSALASIQAVSSTIMMALSPISNALSEKFGCRRVVFLGGTLLLLGFLTSAFVPSYEWLYLTYGVIAGLGFGFSYAPCIVFVGHHFRKYRALANGLSVSGSGFGLFIFPPIIHFFIEWYGLAGALMLVSAFMCHICACAMLFRPLSDYKKRIVKKWVPKSSVGDENEKLLKDGVEIGENCIEKFVKTGVANHKTVEFFRSDVACGSLVDITAISQQSLPTDKTTHKNTSSSLCYKKSTNSSQTEPQCQKYIALLLNPVFQIFLLSTMLTNFAYPSVFIMVPSYAEEIKVDKQSGALMVSIIGISDLIGRVFFGWFSDRQLIPRKYEFMSTMGISGVLSLILPFVKTKEALFVYCGFYGFFAGAYICLIAVVLVDVLGLENLSMGFGIVGLSLAVGLLAGPPIIGALRDITGTWDYSFMFAGLIAIIASLIILLEPLAQKKRQRLKKLKEESKMA